MTKDTILVAELFHYPFLINICMKLFNLKETKNKKLNRFYKKKNINLFRWKNFPWKKTRILLYRSILQQNPAFYHLDLLKRIVGHNQNINFSQKTRSYVLNVFGNE